MRAARALAAVAAVAAAAGDSLYSTSFSGGSLAGGTKLTLFGEGYMDMTNGAQQTRVWVGVNECRIEPYWSTNTQLVCYTPPAPRDAKGFLSSQRLEVRVSKTSMNSNAMYYKSPGVFFQYDPNRTPMLDTHTFGGAAGKRFKAWGTLRTKALSAYRVSAGQAMHSVNSDDSDYDDSSNIMDGNGWGGFRGVWGDVPSGRHNLTVAVDDPTYGMGHATKGRRSLQVTLDGQLYQFTGHPRIANVSQYRSGLGGGAELVITGSGFSWTAADNRVTIGAGAAALDCPVTSATMNEVRCTLPAAPAASGAVGPLRPAGRGLTHRVWYNANSNWASRRADITMTATGALAGFHLNDAENYAQEWAGMFVPPVSAYYSWWVAGDDTVNVYVGANETRASERRLAFMDTFAGNTFFGVASQISAPTFFEAGKAYHFRANHQEGNGGDFITVGLRVHATNPDGTANAAVAPLKSGVQKAYASVSEAQRIAIRTTIVREVQTVSIAGAASGTMLVYWGQAAPVAIPAAASTSQFRNALANIGCWDVSVTRVPFATADNATGFTWATTFNCPTASGWPALSLVSVDLRPVAGVRTVTLASARTVTASQPASGTFALRYNGANGPETTAPIRYDAANWAVESALEALPSISEVEVTGSITNQMDGATYIISFAAPTGDIPMLEMVTNDGFAATLLGNAVTTSVTEIQQGSDDPFYWPVNMDFFRTALPAEPITVITNGILSDCDVFAFNASGGVRACSFAYDASLTPTVASASAASVTAGDELVITGTGFLAAADGVGKGTGGSDLTIGVMNKVFLNDSACTVTAATATELRCTVQHSAAGTYALRVLIGMERGLAVGVSGMPSVTYARRIDSISPASGSKAGGTRLTIAGTGFAATASENSVLVGGSACIVESSTFSEIVCRTPRAADQASATSAVAVSVSGTAAASQFTYDAARTPSVSALSPSRLPASMTGKLTVTVTGVPSATGVAAVRFGARVCRVDSITWTSASAPATVVCTLLRGPARPLPQTALPPMVDVVGLGFAEPANGVALDDSYFVSAVLAAYGSFEGGHEITFTGVGYATPAMIASASASSAYNWVEVAFVHTDSWGYKWTTPLTISSASETSIVATMPAIPGSKRGDPTLWNPATSFIAGNFLVKVNNVSAPCDAATEQVLGGGCGYTQRPASTPKITAAATVADGSAASGLALQLTGSLLDTAGGITVTVGGLPCAPVTDVSSVGLTCRLPVGQAGTAYIVAKLAALGEAAIDDAAVNYTFPFAVASAFNNGPTRGSTAGGALITLSGAGFSATAAQNEVKFGTMLATVTAATASSITVRVPPNLGVTSGSSLAVDISVRNTVAAPAVPAVTLAAAFTYDYAIANGATAEIARVMPASGPLGTVISILGKQFIAGGGAFTGTDSDPTVMIGGVACVVDAARSNATFIRCTVGETPAGTHRVIVNRRDAGFARNAAGTTFTVALTVTSVTPPLVSFGGGQSVTVSGSGFGPATSVRLCNSFCAVESWSYSSVTCRTAPLLTQAALAGFPAFDSAPLRPEATTPAQTAAFDGDVETFFSSQCTLTQDMGVHTRAIVTAVRAYPRFRQVNAMLGGRFQASIDGTNWDTLATLSIDKVFEGWNNVQLLSLPGISNLAPTDMRPSGAAEITPANLASQPAYRYLRFAFAPSVTGSACVGAEVQFIGFAVAAAADGACNANVTVDNTASVPAGGFGLAGAGAPVFGSAPGGAGIVTYGADQTAYVTGISPNNGTALGGTTLTLSGSGFPAGAGAAAAVTVVINGVPCAVQSSAGSTLTCVTGARDEVRPTSLLVTVASGAPGTTAAGTAIVDSASVFFRYIDRWSALTTWKYQEPPVEGDTVIVSEGQAILVDVSPPKLYLVFVEGELIFDNKDLTFDAEYFIAHGGRIQAGTERVPFTNKLTITMHGDRLKQVEVPDMGAKCIVAQDRGMDHDEEEDVDPFAMQWYTKNAPKKRSYSQASIDFHGIPRQRVWTTLASTALAGTNVLTMSEDVDWTVGEKLFVTDNANVWQTEEVEIAEVLGPRSVRLTQLLANDHRSRIVPGGPLGTRDIDERAEVGLLSRNIVVQGADSYRQLYGVHMAAMHGGILRVENIEIRHAGQAGNLGRYPAHFHELHDTKKAPVYVRHNSIHHTHQRGVTVHATHYAEVKGNAIYRTLGHTVFVEDGNERWNTIEGNLVAWTEQCHTCTTSDVKPSSFWMASPTNIWRHNRAAGSTHFGFWFELPGNPMGPSFDPNIFPFHNPLVEFFNNTAHGGNAMGLRIYPHWTPRQRPGDVNSPSLSMYLHNNTFVLNSLGTFHRVVGAVHHVGSLWADNDDGFGWRGLEGGISYHEDNPFIRDSAFVCSTDGPAACGGRTAFTAPQNELWYGMRIAFINYGPDGWPLRGCHSCESPAFFKQGAYTYRVGGLRFQDTARRTGWNVPYKCIFRDVDGTLTGNAGGGWAVAPFGFNNFPQCPKDASGAYDMGNVCDNSVTVRRMHMDWHSPVELDWQSLNVSSTAGWGAVKFRPRETYAWSWPMVMKRDFGISWTRAVAGSPLPDWRRLRVRWSEPAYLEAASSPADEWVRLSFDWGFARYRNRVVYGGYASGGSQIGGVERADLPFGTLPPTNAAFGTGHALAPIPSQGSAVNRTWMVTLSRVNITEPADSNRYAFTAWNEQCPPRGCATPEDMNLGAATRWSDPASWPSGRVPAAGEDVVINSTSYIMMDVNPPKLGRVTVNGRLEFMDNAARKLEADSIVVWGEFVIGTPDAPFINPAEVVVYGTWPDTLKTVILDNNLFLGNKVIAVLGRMMVHGARRNIVWTRLAATAAAGSSSVTLTGSVAGVWFPGDRIVFSATSWDHKSHEVATIASINGATLTLTAPLRFNHFSGPAGAGSVTAGVTLRGAVGLLSRNVVIRGAIDTSFVGGETYGVSIIASTISRGTREAGNLRTITGSLDMRYAEVRDAGKGGLEFPSVQIQYGAFLYTPSATPVANSPVNVFEGVAFSNCFNYGLRAISAPHIIFNNSVVHNTTRHGVWLDAASRNATIVNNFVVGNNADPNLNAPDQQQWIHPQAAVLLDAPAARFSGNLVSGAADSGLTYRPPACTVDAARYGGNEAHGVRIGAFLLPVEAPGFCVRVDDLTVWKAAHLGLTTVDQLSNVQADRITLSDNHIASSFNFFGELNAGRSISRISNSIVIGDSAASPACGDAVCRAADDLDRSGVGCRSVLGPSYRRAGILIPQSLNRGKTCDQDDDFTVCNNPLYPTRLCSMPWEARYGTIGKTNIEFQLANVKFAGFGVGTCGAQKSRAILHNPTQIDMSIPVRASGITWEAATVPLDGRFAFGISYMTNEKCAEGQGCDGVNFPLVQDMDGSLTGRGAGSTVMGNNPVGARSEPLCSKVEAWEGIVCGADAASAAAASVSAPAFSPAGVRARYASTYRKAYLEGLELGRVAMGALQHTRLIDLADNSTWRTTLSRGSIKDMCAMRPMQNWFAHLLNPGTDSALFFPATEPSQIRYYVFNDAADEPGHVMRLYISRPYKFEVFVNGALGLDLATVSNATYTRYPTQSDAPGTFLYHPQEKTLYFTVRPGMDALGRPRVYDLVRKPAVQLNLHLDISVEDFYGPAMIDAMAILLGIPAWRIKIVDVRPGSAAVSMEIADEKPTVFANASSSSAGPTPRNASGGLAADAVDPALIAEATAQVNRLTAIVQRIASLASSGGLQTIAGYPVAAITVTPPTSALVQSTSPTAAAGGTGSTGAPTITYIPSDGSAASAGMSPGVIAAVAVGSILGVALLAGGLLVYRSRSAAAARPGLIGAGVTQQTTNPSSGSGAGGGGKDGVVMSGVSPAAARMPPHVRSLAAARSYRSLVGDGGAAMPSISSANLDPATAGPASPPSSAAAAALVPRMASWRVTGQGPVLPHHAHAHAHAQPHSPSGRVTGRTFASGSNASSPAAASASASASPAAGRRSGGNGGARV